jgi:hypothetical protein
MEEKLKSTEVSQKKKIIINTFHLNHFFFSFSFCNTFLDPAIKANLAVSTCAMNMT